MNRGNGGDLVVARDGTVYADGVLGNGSVGSLSVARSRDGGATWTHTLRFTRHPAGAAYFAPGPLAVDPGNPHVVLAAIGVGSSGGTPVCVRLARTGNGGRSWRAADAGLVPPGRGCPLR